jgi:hypothetical protein
MKRGNGVKGYITYRLPGAPTPKEDHPVSRIDNITFTVLLNASMIITK